ncbi:GTPase [uncultured Brachyspira sp.]|uniref:GTPase n=1 Tax=uncultured Brachyspira sp. TaxID=221953 RepID=UPI00258D78B9|nr:GTPase [uncultured Brachyspira sp.]
MAKVFSKDITKEKAFYIVNEIVKNDYYELYPHSSDYTAIANFIKKISWDIADYFDGKENNNNENEEKNKNFNKENKINNVVENTAKEKIMTEEQKKNCEEIINSYKSKLGGVDISLLMNPFSIIPLIHHQHRYDVKSIISMTISLAKVFNKDISEEEAKKIISDLREDLKQNPKDKKYKDFESMSWAIVDKLDYELILNLLILGKTGTGKSSIVNALVGEDVEETGAGKPKTGKGIFPHEEEIDGKKVVIHDSWGLEVGKDEEWEEIINNALKEKGIDKDIKDWFHSVTYCIQAGGNRIEDFDAKIITKFIKDKYNVIVALTKSDQIGKAKREKFIKEIEKAIKIKIITYRALIKSNLINEVKKEFIKEIEKEIGEIEFEQIEETKSDMYPIAAARVPIFITAIPPINLKYNIVKGLMKSNQIEQSKIEKFIKEIEKEIKETTKIGITVIPISANPEQLDHMTEKPKPYGLEEYKAAILLSWEKIFIDRIPLHIIEKLKKDIENAKYNAPNRKPKNDDDLKILAKEIQEYFNNVLKENLQSRIKENFEKYYKITEDIININTNIDISNFYSRKNIDTDTYLYDYIGFSISHLFEHIKDLFKYLYNRMKIKENIEEFINKTYKETKEYISKKEFEDNIRKSIIDIFNKIENKKN